MSPRLFDFNIVIFFFYHFMDFINQLKFPSVSGERVNQEHPRCWRDVMTSHDPVPGPPSLLSPDPVDPLSHHPVCLSVCVSAGQQNQPQSLMTDYSKAWEDYYKKQSRTSVCPSVSLQRHRVDKKKPHRRRE